MLLKCSLVPLIPGVTRDHFQGECMDGTLTVHCTGNITMTATKVSVLLILKVLLSSLFICHS